MKKKWIVLLFSAVVALGGASNVKAETSIIPNEIETIDELKNYERTTLNFENGETELILPMSIPEKGGLILGVAQNFYSKFLNLEISVFENADCTKQCGSSMFLFDEDSSVNETFVCKGSGTYYLKAKLTRNYGEDDDISFALSSAFLSSEDRALEKPKEFVCTFDEFVDEDCSYRITAAKDGLLVIGVHSIEGSSESSKSITLTKEDGTILVEDCSVNEDSAVSSAFESNCAVAAFAVEKGTYSVKVSSTETYAVGYDFIKVGETSGVSKKKAVKLKFGKEVKGTVSVTDGGKVSDWYCINLPKKQNFKLSVQCITNDVLTLEILDKKGNSIKGGLANIGTEGYTFKTTGKWKKGTYYVRIGKPVKRGSGYYVLKLEK